jgi:hypothetical protein
MNKVNKHIELGLSQEELSTIVKSAGNDGVINQYNDKLENCDLSRPSIELVKSEDLEAILKISNGINNKYLGNRISSFFKKCIIVLVALIAISSGVLIFIEKEDVIPVETESTVVSVDEKHELVLKIPEEIPVDREANKNKETSNEIVVGNQSENNNQQSILATTDSLVKDSSEVEVLKNVDLGDEVKKDPVEKTTQDPAKVNFTKAPRIVRGVLVTGLIDPKYKGDNYKISNLVDYQGGNGELQKEIFRKLKQKIKDDDIPSSSSTIVFNFEVTSRGKVKKVSIQSRTTPELEVIIIQTIEGLDAWRKGSKRASKNYSVFVTFK